MLAFLSEGDSLDVVKRLKRAALLGYFAKDKFQSLLNRMVMPNSKQKLSPDVLLLTAPYFDETAVVVCLSLLREAGLSVFLVNPRSGLVVGTHGITIRADIALGQTEQINIHQCRLLIIAGGQKPAAKNLSDPRTHQLIKQILEAGGAVGIMAKAYSVAVETGVLTEKYVHQIFKQGETETAVFVQQLIEQIQ